MHLLFALLLQTLPAQHFPPIAHPGADPAMHSKIVALCPLPQADDRGALLKHEDQLIDSLRGHDTTVALWSHPACARALLGDAGARSHPGLLLPDGASWYQGAINVLLKVLDLRPAEASTAELLALLALDDIDVDNVPKITAVMQASARTGVTSSAVLRSCTHYSLASGDTTHARDCAARSLTAGRDSTWQLLRLARLSFAHADTLLGTSLFYDAIGAAHDSLAHLEVTWHLQWLLTPDEQRQWLEVRDAQRTGWVRDRLAARDIRDGQPAGARLAEHFNRLNYVEKHFQLAVSRQTGEALRTGPATTAKNDAFGYGALSWEEPGDVSAREWREYKRWQLDFDDRGVVWMRFGAPEQRIPWVAQYPSMNVREAWVYNIDDRHLLVSFEYERFAGSAQATRLVTGVLGSYFCDIDAKRCALSTLSQADAVARSHKGATAPQFAMAKQEQLEAVRREDLAAISAATTTDDNSPRGQRFIDVSARLHRLWDPASGAPVALVTYAIALKDLKTDTTSAAIQLQLLQWDPTTTARHDTTLTRNFLLAAAGTSKHLVGFLVQPSSPGVDAWNLVVTQPDARRGRAFEEPSAPLGIGSIVLSDLIVGSESEHLQWNTGGNAVPLAPLNAVNRTEPLQLYYQVRSAEAMPLRTAVAWYRTDARDPTKPALEVSYPSTVQRGINEIAPVADVSRLDAGEYRIEIRLVDDTGKERAHRQTTIYLR